MYTPATQFVCNYRTNGPTNRNRDFASKRGQLSGDYPRGAGKIARKPNVRTREPLNKEGNVDRFRPTVPPEGGTPNKKLRSQPSRSQFKINWLYGFPKPQFPNPKFQMERGSGLPKPQSKIQKIPSPKSKTSLSLSKLESGHTVELAEMFGLDEIEARRVDPRQ